MAKFEVEYEHEVVITYRAIVDAETEEEARLKISEGSFDSEEEEDYQGMYIRVRDVKKL